jgi:hypothetical protein
MSSIVIKGDTSGQVTLDVPAIAGTTILNLPASSGTVVVGSVAASAVGQIPFSTDGATYTPTAKIVSGTAVASTSGTSIDFTGIPSWVKRITVMFSGVSTSGTSPIQIQLGTGSTTYTTSGYLGSCSTGGGTASTMTAGFTVSNSHGASDILNGFATIQNLSGNNWVENSVLGRSDTSGVRFGGGSLDLAATLTAIRVTTINGTDTFDAGSINILYE